ncbi:unnamed protein product [Prunus brigantina]
MGSDCGWLRGWIFLLFCGCNGMLNFKIVYPDLLICRRYSNSIADGFELITAHLSSLDRA